MTANLDPILRQEITERALATFRRKAVGIWDDLAYLNGGGKLFEDGIAASYPDYYQFYGEVQHIQTNKASIADLIKDTQHIIVVGPGPATSFSQKDFKIIELLPDLKSVQFIDVASRFNDESAAVIEAYSQRSGKNITVAKHRMDFHQASQVLLPLPHTTTISTGGLFANLQNAPLDGFPVQDMQDSLAAFRRLSGDEGHVIVGYDSNTNDRTQAKAYQNFGPFIINITNIIANNCDDIHGFKSGPDYFAYRRDYIPPSRQNAHKVVALKSQDFYIGSRYISIDQGEPFTVMSSLRPDPNKTSEQGKSIGLRTANAFIDGNGLVEHVFNSVAIPRAPGSFTQMPMPFAQLRSGLVDASPR